MFEGISSGRAAALGSSASAGLTPLERPAGAFRSCELDEELVDDAHRVCDGLRGEAVSAMRGARMCIGTAAIRLEDGVAPNIAARHRKDAHRIGKRCMLLKV